MQSRDFAFWLQGFFELTAGQPQISSEQAELIKTHLALVFKHDPTMAHKSAPIAPPTEIGTPYKPVGPLVSYC